MLKLVLPLLSDKRLQALLLCLAREVAKRTENTVDDSVVRALDEALLGSDKAKNKAVKNGKAKKA